MLGVCGTSLVSPGWADETRLVGVTVGMGDVFTLKMGRYMSFQISSVATLQQYDRCKPRQPAATVFEAGCEVK